MAPARKAVRTRAFPLLVVITLFRGGAAFAEGEDLGAILKAWEASVGRLKGRVTLNSDLRQSIGMERTTRGAVITSRPSMLDRRQPPPTRLEYKKLKRAIETKGKVDYRLEGESFGVSLSFTPARGGSSTSYSASWNGGWWEESSGGSALAPAEFGESKIRHPFGLLYTGSYRDAGPGVSFVELMRRRKSAVSREGDLLKVHAPANAGDSGESPEYTFWLSPTKGMLPVRWECGGAKGPVEIRVENRLEEVRGGLWAPTRITARMFVPDPQSPLLNKVIFESIQEMDPKNSDFGSSLLSGEADRAEPSPPKSRLLANPLIQASACAIAGFFLAGVAWRRKTRRV